MYFRYALRCCLWMVNGFGMELSEVVRGWGEGMTGGWVGIWDVC